jgi:enterochelin esterase-like enzyme
MKNIILFFFILFTENLIAQIPKVSFGKIEHFEKFKSSFVIARDVDVWLPAGYDPKKKYAVIYMHDGKALFDSSIIWTHQTWGVDEVLNKLLSEQKIKDCIAVGISNGGEIRHSEYLPQKPFENLPKEKQDYLYNIISYGNQHVFTTKINSDNYLKFIVQELKPFIDAHFSTLKDQQHTFIIGSSMGGLISIYALCEYPQVFGGAACLSTHWTGLFTAANNPLPGAIIGYLRTHLPSPKNHKVYFDYGSKTLDTLYKPFQVQVDTIMHTKGFTNNNWITKEFVGADHTETSWHKRLDIPILFLLKK